MKDLSKMGYSKLDGLQNATGSAYPVFSSDGSDRHVTEITPPKASSGTISKPNQPASQSKGDALSAMIEECIVTTDVKWDDIQGLEDVKKTLQETIIYP